MLAAPGLDRQPAVDALEVVAGSGAEPSRSVVEAAVAGDITVVRELADADASDSLVLSGVRSVLCAPVRVRGELVACLYVSHRELGGVFRDDEAHIAGFLTALAGAALENAEGFAEIQALTTTLEDRIAARTSELSDANEELAAAGPVQDRAGGHHRPRSAHPARHHPRLRPDADRLRRPARSRRADQDAAADRQQHPPALRVRREPPAVRPHRVRRGRRRPRPGRPR